MAEPTSKSSRSRREASKGDHLLRSMIEQVNQGQDNPYITVISGGIMLSGRMIGGREFLTQFERYSDPEHDLGEGFRAMLDQEYPLTAEPNLGDSNADFLHLSDVWLSGAVNASMYQSAFPYWRVRVTEISAWTLGQYGAKWQDKK